METELRFSFPFVSCIQFSNFSCVSNFPLLSVDRTVILTVLK
jgi:hypothetical protein